MFYFRNIANIFRYEFIFVFSIFFLYIIQSFLGMYYFGINPQTITALFLPTYAIMSFVAIFYLCKKFLINIKIKKIELNINISIIYGIFLSYLVIIFLLCITCPKIPLVSSLLGDNQSEIYNYRLAYDLTRIGWEKFIVYFYILYYSFICPLAIIILFDKENKYKWLVLFIFTSTLLFSLAKTICIKAFLPLIFYYLISAKKNLKRTMLLTLFLCFSVFLSTFFYFAGPKKIYDTISSISVTDKSDTIEIQPPQELPNFIFSSQTPASFMLNRFLWTPYATLYAYLGFRYEIMKDKDVSVINTIRPISILFEKKYFPYDQLAFNYQYSFYDNNDQLRTEFIGINAAPYFVEIYAKYGFLFLFFISIFIPIFFYLVIYHSSDIIKAFFPLCILLMISNPFITVLTNGMAFLFILLFFDIHILKSNLRKNS